MSFCHCCKVESLVKKLLLFDIDGTLVSRHEGHNEAFAVAFKEVHGLYASIHMVDYHGKTDQQIIRDVLSSCGVSEDAIDAKMNQFMQVMSDYYVAVGPNLTTDLFEGVGKTLEALNSDDHLLGLVTGNLEPIAHTKLGRADIDKYFTLGGFGNEAVDRSALVLNAIEKAKQQFGFQQDDNVFVIGDTPRDIDAATRAGVKSIGVTTGAYSSVQLAQAGAASITTSVGDTEAFLKAVS